MLGKMKINFVLLLQIQAIWEYQKREKNAFGKFVEVLYLELFRNKNSIGIVFTKEEEK